MYKINFRYLQNKSRNYSFGFDYLRLVYNQKIDFFENKIKNLVSNSTFVIEDQKLIDLEALPYITYIKMGKGKNPMILGAVSVGNLAIPVLCYVPFSGANKKACRIDIYGEFFRLLQEGFFSENFLFDYLSFISKEDGELTRADWRYDYFSNDELRNFPPYNTVVKGVNKKTSIRTYSLDHGKLNSWSLGSKLSGNIIIRFYNKQLDLLQKGKAILYSEYFESKKVYRLEIQFDRHFCKYDSLRNYKISELTQFIEKIKKYVGFENSFNGLYFVRYPGITKLGAYGKDSLSYKQFQIYGLNLIKHHTNPFFALDELEKTIGKDELDLYRKEYINDKNNNLDYEEAGFFMNRSGVN